MIAQRTVMTNVCFGVGLTLLLASCTHVVQTSSGADYLSRYSEVTEGSSAVRMDAEIAEAANVEPTLTFPARIGVARIITGQLAPIPPAEAAAWQQMAERLGPDWGEFVPISPLVAALASPAVEAEPCARYYYGGHPASGVNCLRETVQAIRLGAARQHVDVALIYEAFSDSQDSSNPLAITKLALVGFFLPTEYVEASGVAQAILVDVRNGYPYGTAMAASEDSSGQIYVSGDLRSARGEVLAEAQVKAVQALTVEVEQMARTLRQELEAKRLADARVQ